MVAMATERVRWRRPLSLSIGLAGSLIAAAGVWRGLNGDTVLGAATTELDLVAVITVMTLFVLVVPRADARVRAVGLASCAFGYHVILSRWWLPWIDKYTAAVGGGGEFSLQEASALPLLMAGGLLIVASAVLTFPATRPVPSGTVRQ